MSLENIRQKTISGLFWAFSEKIGTQLIGLAVSIILARLLMPEEYGVISVVFVFINLCSVFVDSGFTRALIQKDNVDDIDYSSVFCISLAVSLAVYSILFFSAPYIAVFYNMSELEAVIRVMGLQLLVAPYSSILKAIVSKKMEFRKFFFSRLGGTVASAVIGITMAYCGFGVWALAALNLSDILIDVIVLALGVKWVPHMPFSLTRVQQLGKFGGRIFLGELLDSLYTSFRSLYIGKIYSAEDLAFYSKGSQFPSLLVDNINSSIGTVLFPAISSQKNNPQAMKAMTKRAIKTGSYVLTPMLCGLAVVAEPLVRILLTDKWLPCVPYMQILCINNAFMPLHTANTQAVYASGRSDIALRINILKMCFSLTVVVIFARISVLAMAWADVATSVFCLCVNIMPNKKLIDYGIGEQIKDILPGCLISGLMMLAVLAVRLLALPPFFELCIMVLVGIFAYILFSCIFQLEIFTYLLGILKSYVNKK